MSRRRPRGFRIALFACVCSWALTISARQEPVSQIGREVAITRHLSDGQEFQTPLPELVAYGRKLFEANWTTQEGGGRPLTKGTGKDLADPSQPLVGSRAFNRVSGPDANSCAGCHNMPFGFAGGGGDFVTNVFVLGQRFDFATLGAPGPVLTAGGVDEAGRPVSLQTVGNSRATPGMFGAGYIEMLARQITEELHAIRDTVSLGQTTALVSKGISFGYLTLGRDGMWDTSKVTGMSRLSLLAPTPLDKPSLVVRPWHQASNVVSLREFVNTSFNHHHGIQTTERFGQDTDPDGDGFSNEMTRADVTAVSVFQAAMQVPGRVIPNDPAVERAVLAGEELFERIGCGSCHVPSLRLERSGWMFSEPNPYNAATNLRPGDAPVFQFDLTDPRLPEPRLRPTASHPTSIDVPVYTDFKLHDITDPADPAEAEPLDMNQSLVSPRLLQGNRRFLTKRLWGAANEPPYFHHGLFTTLRQAVLAHSGEALEQRRAFRGLPAAEQDAVIEFLKSLQILPPGTRDIVVDEHYRKKAWPPAWGTR